MELWDLYDVDRKITDKKMYRGEETPEGYYRLVVGICIFKLPIYCQMNRYYQL